MIKFKLLKVIVFIFITITFILMVNNWNDETMSNTKKIPSIIEKEAKIALSHYPELENVPIDFVIKKSLKKSFMKAQPRFSSFFKTRNNRAYIIYMSDTFKLDGLSLRLNDIPKEVLIGWLGHELGHVMDYRSRSAFGMIIFGIRYITSSGFTREAERSADTYAVSNGMVDYILKTKSFILDNANLSEKYKNHIKRNYLSPDQILLIAKEQDSLQLLKANQ